MTEEQKLLQASLGWWLESVYEIVKSTQPGDAHSIAERLHGEMAFVNTVIVRASKPQS